MPALRSAWERISTAATVITAGYDPLRDEGLAYAKRLEKEGVPTSALHYAGQIHGFLTFPGMARAEEAIPRAAAELARSLAP